MERNDVELIRNTMSGDDSSFSFLVEKYQKSVHALAWRKVQDFQVAEEIAQDAFLQAYQKLATLKNPNQFAGWLYVITSNLCHDWHRRKKPTMQSLEATNSSALDQSAYERYLVEQREKAASEQRQELVRNLLEKLPESERTVVTLHYLGEMTSEAIGKFLGVSVNTIKSRLRRARKRLKEEELMIRETLGSVQLSNNFTENIMKEITNIKPSPASNGKPFLPWAALGSAAVLILLLMGASNQYSTRFQQPYNLEVQSDTTVEVVNTPIILDIHSKPDSHRRIGNTVLAKKNGGANQLISDGVIASDEKKDSTAVSPITHEWTQAIGPQGGDVHEIFLTSDEKLYAVLSTGIYKMTEDESGWVLINNTVPIESHLKMPMAERGGTLYIVSADDIFASTNGGVTWNSIGARPRGTVIELLIIDDAFYLIMDDDLYRSTDSGKQWTQFNVGIKGREIFAADAIENTIFVGTDRGIYRLDSDNWEQLSVGTFRTVNSIAVSDNTVYVSTQPDDKKLNPSELKTKLVREIMRKENSKGWEIFQSGDLGESWTKITPPKKSFLELIPLEGRILAVGKTVLVTGMNSYRSIDGGLTWTNLGYIIDSRPSINSLAVAVNKDVFYTESFNKLSRSTDAGESWQPFMKGMVGSDLNNIIVFNNRMYAYFGFKIVQSTDGGDTWTNVRVDSVEEILPGKKLLLNDPMLTVAGNSLYGIIRDGNDDTRLYRLDSSGDVLVPIQGIPSIEEYFLSNQDLKNNDGDKTSHHNDILKNGDSSRDRARFLLTMLGIPDVRGLAVSGDTFYVGYDRRLMKWEPRESKWIDTGFDTGEEFNLLGYNLAASGKNVYVGKEDGHLFQSHDAGNKWEDITSSLPLKFERFNEIVFLGSTVYVITDKGVLTSQTGRQWHAITDGTGKNVVMDCLAVDGTKVYGACRKGIYQLDDLGEWELISQSLPDWVRDFVIHNDKFYVTTSNRGMFHIPLK